MEASKDTESTATIQGASAQMNTFQFDFGTMLAETVLRHTDNLSRSLQKKVYSAAEGQTIGAMVVNTHQSIQSDASFELFWSKVATMTEPLSNPFYLINVRHLKGMNLEQLKLMLISLLKICIGNTTLKPLI